MTSEDPTILRNPDLSLRETQEGSSHYFCQELSDNSIVFFQFLGISSSRELQDRN